ncbi:MAG: hypothetical protein HDS97_08760 [Bacteroidales bacterium]|nr:hypothetical protein [Bacteroidales bacterium]
MEKKLSRIAAFIDSLPAESTLEAGQTLILSNYLDIYGGVMTNKSACENGGIDCYDSQNQKGCINVSGYCGASTNSGGCKDKDIQPGPTNVQNC